MTTDMKTPARLCLVAAVVLGLVATAGAQKLPGGTVTAPPKQTLKRPVKKTLSKKPTAALLIVVTAPNAKIALNGVPTGQADVQGQFETEVAAGEYAVRASAGDDFLPSERSVVVAARQRQIVALDLTSRFGDIVVSVPGLEDATIALDGVPVAAFDASGTRRPPREGQAVTVAVDSAKRAVTIGRVPGGTHTIRFEKPGLDTVEESVILGGGETQRLAVRSGASEATVEVAAEPGTAVLLDGAHWGRTGADGRFAGRAAGGNHVLRFERPGFEPQEQRRVFEVGGQVRVEARLTPSLTSVGFGDDFEMDLGRWDHPAEGWSLAGGALVISGAAEPGLARGVYYGDFVFSFNLTMSSPGGGAWLLRARDARNYYLFSLSGPTGRYPNRLAVYVVQDGKLDTASPAATPVPISSKLDVGAEYYVEVTARGNRIETRITPLATGVAESLGEFVDPQGLFPTGGIGFRAVAGERFEIDDAYADPP